MSEANQLKPGQLIPSSTSSLAGGLSEFDQMFNGLGLGSYVSGKKDSASIATSMMASNSSHSSSQSLSLSDKQKLLRDTETASKVASQPPLRPQVDLASKPPRQTKDLTATLMEANINQMKQSQTFSNFSQWPQFQAQPVSTGFPASTVFPAPSQTWTSNTGVIDL